MTANSDESATISSEAAASCLVSVRERIAAAAAKAGRSSDAARLVAVSKTFGPGAIVALLAAGQRLFGENRVQEADAKWPALKARYPDVELHLIGPLQSNKVREAVVLFDVIETIDRPKIARAVAAEMGRQGRRLALYLQVNTGEEPQKSGVVPAELGALLALCRGELGIEVAGLMCIPPLDEEAGIHFAFLAKLARQHGLAELSMGMSADFESAIAFGATSVRVGSAIFGARA